MTKELTAQDHMTTTRERWLTEEQTKWLKVVEVAKALRIGRETIYRMIHEGQLPALRSGRTIRVHIDDLKQLTSNQASVNTFKRTYGRVNRRPPL